MKTQIALGACDSVFFPVPPIKAGESNRVNGGSPYFPRLSSEPIAAGQISVRTPARNGHSGLPASLADWLVCKEALEIRQGDCNGAKNGHRALVTTAKPASRAEVLPTAGLRPETAA